MTTPSPTPEQAIAAANTLAVFVLERLPFPVRKRANAALVKGRGRLDIIATSRARNDTELRAELTVDDRTVVIFRHQVSRAS
jgi:hypothetical protein